MAVEFWFEFASTYSYPAAMRIEAAAAQHGVSIVWRPFLLGPIFKQEGWNDSPFNIYPAKGRYMWRDLARICADLELPLRKPSVFPRNGLLAARVACLHADAAWLPAFVRAVYRANFSRDQDISAVAVVTDCLQQAGQNPQTVLAATESPEAKEKLRQQTERAIQLGIFGAPSFVVNGELFWGNDRMESAFRWALTNPPRQPTIG